MTYGDLVTQTLEGLSAKVPDENVSYMCLDRVVDLLIGQLPQLDKKILTDTFLELRANYPNLSILTSLEAIA